MVTERPPFALKLMPSFTDFAFLMPVAFLFGRMDGVKTLLSDCDTGWHIRTGEWILANHSVPAHDIFSFSKAGAPWFAWEWLADVVFAGLNAWGGLHTVALFAILMLALTFTLLFRLVRRRSNVIVAILVTMLAGAASSIHYLARPHLFTFVFLIWYIDILERVRLGNRSVAGMPWLAILPFLTAVWTNLHGGFFLGILMIAAYGAGTVFQIAFSADRSAGPKEWKNARGYFVSALACLAASLANPYFYHLHEHIWKYLRDPYNSQHIMEFLSPSFHHPTAFFFEAMLVLGAAAAFWNLSKGRFIEPLLLLLWAHGGLLAARNIPIFAIAAAVPVAAAIQEWLDLVPGWNVAGWARSLAGSFNQLARTTGETEAVGRWHLVSIAGVVALGAVIWAPHPPKKFRAEFDPNFYPAGALATLRRNPSSRIFTDDEWGDYLIWSLYPAQKVFVDGRSDFYGDDFEEKFIDVLNVKYGWDKTLGGFGVDTILLPLSAPLTGALKESSHWRVVYDDGNALVFRLAEKPVGRTGSAALGDGSSRDREVTKTQTSDPVITETKSKT